jgi:hypothetical protein
VCFALYFPFCVFVLFLLMYIVVSFLFLYKFTDKCHRVEAQMQLLNMIYQNGRLRVTVSQFSISQHLQSLLSPPKRPNRFWDSRSFILIGY